MHNGKMVMELMNTNDNTENTMESNYLSNYKIYGTNKPHSGMVVKLGGSIYTNWWWY